MTSVFWSSDDWQVKRNTLHRFSAFAWEELHRFNSSLKETFILELDPDKCCCFIDVPFRLISTILMTTALTARTDWHFRVDITTCDLTMSKDWSNQCSSQKWNWHDNQWNQSQEPWNQPNSWQPQEVPPRKIRTPLEYGRPRPRCLMMNQCMAISSIRRYSQRLGVGERIAVDSIHLPFQLGYSHVMGHQSMVWDSTPREDSWGSSPPALLRKVFSELNCRKQWGIKEWTYILFQNISTVPQIQNPSQQSRKIQSILCPLWYTLLFPN